MPIQNCLTKCDVLTGRFHVDQLLTVRCTPTNTTLYFLFSCSWSETALTSRCFNTIVTWLQQPRSNSYQCMNSYKFNTVILKPYLRSFTKMYSQEEMMTVVSDNLFFFLTVKSSACHCPFPTFYSLNTYLNVFLFLILEINI